MQIEALRKPLFHLTIVGAEPDLQSKTINFCLQKVNSFLLNTFKKSSF
jgi:hypothetical protein